MNGHVNPGSVKLLQQNITGILQRMQPIFRHILAERERAEKFFKVFEQDSMPRLGKDFFVTRPVRAQLDNHDYEMIASKVSEQLKPKLTLPDSKNYFLPPNAKWEKLQIKFINGHDVEVKYQNRKPKTFSFDEMGFKNHKTEYPDTKWEFLRKMSETGSINNSKFDLRFDRTVKYETAQRLMKFFNLDDNPFRDYTRKDGYCPKFMLFPEE